MENFNIDEVSIMDDMTKEEPPTAWNATPEDDIRILNEMNDYIKHFSLVPMHVVNEQERILFEVAFANTWHVFHDFFSCDGGYESCSFRVWTYDNIAENYTIEHYIEHYILHKCSGIIFKPKPLHMETNANISTADYIYIAETLVKDVIFTKNLDPMDVRIKMTLNTKRSLFPNG